ncbi:hypothetical protein Wildcat_50 [Mycobacterium phage Wildcat]|uniref:Uncharacterized protein n=4 Tax=Mycobacterium virus Wildcat TaxID=1993859 RepID=Q19Y10_9CAUD|nr:hypothetical protein Wildcat_50 [Mycobacterium phage Wildcat]AJD82122.1 hypothetical protein COSMO_50 [Mycobacterium phage Cosmo]AQT25722.1 hypothetical protein EniyanLRS_47 [Mycobacterium phage EniyanLRS]QGJ89940.1 hypothetical protein PBI_MARYV_50 [Mycobacterium phage MaryV]WKR36060.1 hypothetical protein [Mycobacterium phage Azrael100]ABE67655.1 hypothetical protein Wildcat_50 [Mycobacterium phage Wildcat]
MSDWLYDAGAWTGRNLVAPFLDGLLDEVGPVVSKHVSERVSPKNWLKGLFS